MSWPGVFDPGVQCTFCGHAPHDDPCPRTITAGTAKTRRDIPCHCAQPDTKEAP